MKIIRHPKKSRLHQPVVALGNFDGVHLGHQKVIESAVKYARKIGTHSAVITFDPHPQELILPERGLRLLTTLQEREDYFQQSGVDSTVVVNFTHKLKKLTARQFIENYLVGKLGVCWVFVGYDYAFGSGRSGGLEELKALGKIHGFGVTSIAQVKVGGQIAKSGKIRALLCEGEFSSALKMLGHPFRISGKVVKGDGRGSNLGFPTANLKIDPRKLIPASGVYAGFVEKKRCVVNIGSRPTFGASKLQVEVHILNFTQNLRGKVLKVDLFRRLREERQFADVAELVAQIKKDIVHSRSL